MWKDRRVDGALMNRTCLLMDMIYKMTHDLDDEIAFTIFCAPAGGSLEIHTSMLWATGHHIGISSSRPGTGHHADDRLLPEL